MGLAVSRASARPELSVPGLPFAAPTEKNKPQKYQWLCWVGICLTVTCRMAVCTGKLQVSTSGV